MIELLKEYELEKDNNYIITVNQYNINKDTLLKTYSFESKCLEEINKVFFINDINTIINKLININIPKKEYDLFTDLKNNYLCVYKDGNIVKAKNNKYTIRLKYNKRNDLIQKDLISNKKDMDIKTYYDYDYFNYTKTELIYIDNEIFKSSLYEYCDYDMNKLISCVSKNIKSPLSIRRFIYTDDYIYEIYKKITL